MTSTNRSVLEKLRKQSLLEEEAIQSKIQFQTVFDESTFGNKIINSDLLIQKVNKALVFLLGYSEKELLGKLIVDFSHPDFRHHWHLLQEMLWTKKLPSFSIETCLNTKDGLTIWCQVTSIIFADNGETLGYTIVEDITERKSLETLRSNSEAKKDEFLSIVSHELKTPLTNIKAINQLLSKTVKKEEKYYPFIERSANQIFRLERMIRDLLDVTKINSGQVDLTISEFNFMEAFGHSVSSVQQITKSHRIKVIGSADVKYKGDRFRIEQVLINFLSNAVKYSPDGDEIIITSAVLANNIVVSIEDFGIGIPQKDLNKLAERFYRVNETSMQYQGMGLGLYIAAEILKKHHGEFWVTSKLGRGSTFSFRLPLKVKEIAPAMENRRVFKDDTVCIKYIKETHCVEVGWTGMQDFDSIKKGCMNVLDMLKTHNCEKIINDYSNDGLETMSDADEWMGKEWFPLLEKSGLKYFAWIYASSTSSQLSANNSVDMQSGNVIIQLFNDPEEAKTWLTNCHFVE